MNKLRANQVITVAGFTFKDAVRKKSFWITNIIIMMTIFAAVVIVPRITGGSGGGMPGMTGLPENGAAEVDMMETYNDFICYLYNESDALNGAEQLLREDFKFEVRSTSEQEIEDVLAKVAKNSQAALLEIRVTEQNQPPVVKITCKDFMTTFPGEAVWQALSAEYRVVQFKALGYDAEESAAIVQSALPMEQGYAAAGNISNFVAGMALMVMMFMTIYVYGYGVATGVATEKSTRVMETLVVSAKPARILVGKCIGMGLVGLAQMMGILLFSFICAKVFVPSGDLGGGISLPSLTIGKAALLVVYFLLGYALFSMINSMCGAMVSKLEDLQSAMMPAAMISMISFYGGYITMGVTPAVGGGEGARKLTMLIPFTAPFSAPSVLLSGEYTPGLIAASIGILFAAIVVVSYISGKVYSVSIMHYGGRLRFRDIRRMLRVR